MSKSENSLSRISTTGLATLTQAQLNDWAITAQAHSQAGQLPHYIPLLAQANPTRFAIQTRSIEGQMVSAGDVTLSFPLMSVVKPLVLLFLLEQLGKRTVFSRVGIQYSNEPYNSLIQLQADKGWPRNPMINSGAIALADLLPGQDAPSRCEALRQWLNQRSNSTLFLDEAMLKSVRSRSNERNSAIANLLAESGYLDNVDMALDTYKHICCLAGTVADLTQLGMILVQNYKNILPENRRIVNALMTTCGLYEASSRFAVQVGVPTKSGVSGAVLAVIPSQGAIACYSPPLDEAGNSKAGLFLLQQLVQTLNLSVFG